MVWEEWINPQNKRCKVISKHMVYYLSWYIEKATRTKILLLFLFAHNKQKVSIYNSQNNTLNANWSVDPKMFESLNRANSYTSRKCYMYNTIYLLNLILKNPLNSWSMKTINNYRNKNLKFSEGVKWKKIMK